MLTHGWLPLERRAGALWPCPQDSARGARPHRQESDKGVARRQQEGSVVLTSRISISFRAKSQTTENDAPAAPLRRSCSRSAARSIFARSIFVRSGRKSSDTVQSSAMRRRVSHLGI